MTLENADIVPEALKAEYVKTLGTFNWELKNKKLLDYPEDLLMGENRTLTFSRNRFGRSLILICEFNNPPEEPVYARFTSTKNGTSLDTLDENHDYICPHILGKQSLEQHVRLAGIAVDFLRTT